MTDTRRRRGCAVLILLFALAEARADVDLSAEQARNLDVRSATLPAASAALEFPAVARVLDPLPLLRLDGAWRSAVAAAQAAEAEADRAQRLHGADDAVSLRAVESARAAAVAAQAHRDEAAAERRLGLGADLLALDDATRARLLRELGEGRSQLLRLEALDGNAAAAAGGVLDDGGTDGAVGGVPLRWLGTAPQAASGARAYLALASDAALVPGVVRSARLRAAAQRREGLRLPDAAVLRWQGADCVYVAVAAQRYARREVQLLQRLDHGDWLAAGLDPATPVVVQGAAAVLAADLAQDAPPPATDGD